MSVAHERRIVAYPCHLYSCLIKGYIAKKDISNTEAVEEMARNFFDKMSAKEREEYLNQYKLTQKNKNQ